jgi:short-subunit dehydrogenase
MGLPLRQRQEDTMSKPQVVVITGASSGIGRATALRLARQKASVVLTSRREAVLQEVAAECVRLGGRAIAVPADVTDWDAMQGVAERALQEYGRIDAWINNAGVGLYGAFWDVPLDEFRRVLDVNIMGYVHGARAALEVFRQQEAGVLVNVASIAGEIPMPYADSYGMSKAAVRALGVSLRGELRLQKLKRIHVSTVLPPTVDTPFFQHAANYSGRRILAMPPVYSVDKVAAALIRATRAPRAEITIGGLAKSFVQQHRMTPKPVEAQMAMQVNTTHLSPLHSAENTSGNLFEPGDDSGELQPTGGWAGRSRTAGRLVLAGVLTAGAGVAVQRLARRAA